MHALKVARGEPLRARRRRRGGFPGGSNRLGEGRPRHRYRLRSQPRVPRTDRRAPLSTVTVSRTASAQSLRNGCRAAAVPAVGSERCGLMVASATVGLVCRRAWLCRPREGDASRGVLPSSAQVVIEIGRAEGGRFVRGLSGVGVGARLRFGSLGSVSRFGRRLRPGLTFPACAVAMSGGGWRGGAVAGMH